MTAIAVDRAGARLLTGGEDYALQVHSVLGFTTSPTQNRGTVRSCLSQSLPEAHASACGQQTHMLVSAGTRVMCR